MNAKGNITLQTFSTNPPISCLLLALRYTTRMNSNMQRLAKMRHMTIQMSRRVMQLTLGTDSLTPLNIVVMVMMVVIPIATLPGIESGGMQKEKQPAKQHLQNVILKNTIYPVSQRMLMVDMSVRDGSQYFLLEQYS